MTFDRLSKLLAPVALSAALAAGAAPAMAYTDVYAFGDSLSDNGNLLGLSGYPPAPYWQGRFSNGPVAVEQVAASLGATLHDYAYGGANSGLFNGNFAPQHPLGATGLLSQVSGFAAGLAGAPADSAGLYVVWAGANDFLHPALPAQMAAAIAVGNLVQSVGNLYQMGARDFLLPLLPDLGATPQVLALGAGTSAYFTGVSTSFNALLGSAYQLLEGSLPGASLTVFDTFTAQHVLAASGTFSNTTGMCIAAASCNGYMFFDGVHPTTATHTILGQQMAAAVPEPSAMLMMAAGVLALLGKAARRQRRG